jgi:hypothetical protein
MLTGLAWLAGALAGAQSPSVTGTVIAVRAEAGELAIRSDQGETITVPTSADAVLQRVSPGQRSLKDAQPVLLSEIQAGDRVLVTFVPARREARRVVVMPAAAIRQRQEADREDWQRRGVAGVVAEKKPGEIVLRQRSFMGVSMVTVRVTGDTVYRRYAPDSVKFSDARPSRFEEIRPGDQLRARGEKSEDGLRVTAEEVVFGRFVTKAGSIVRVDAAAGELTMRELDSGEAWVVKVRHDSQIKRMPDFPGMGGGGPRGGGMAGPPVEGGRPGGAFGGAPPGMPPPGVGGGPGRGGPRDLSQMLERMPDAALDELQPGETIVVSSTEGRERGRLTAIMLLANAGRLLEMASAQNGRRDAGGQAEPGLGAGGGLSLGAGGFELPAMLP